MIREFIVALTMFGNRDAICIRKIPSIVMYPFHEAVTHPWLTAHGKISAILVKYLITCIKNEPALFDNMLNRLHADQHTGRKFIGYTQRIYGEVCGSSVSLSRLMA